MIMAEKGPITSNGLLLKIYELKQYLSCSSFMPLWA